MSRIGQGRILDLPASVTSINARRQGTYVLLETHLPGQPARNIGVYLVDPASDRLWLRMRQAYEGLADPEDIEVLQALEEDIVTRASEMGAEAFLASLEDSLSNVIRVSGRQSVEVDAFSRVADRLCKQQLVVRGIWALTHRLPTYPRIFDPDEARPKVTYIALRGVAPDLCFQNHQSRDSIPA